MENQIDDLQEKNKDLQEKNKDLQKELELYKSLFNYPLSNSCIFNLKLVSKNGEKVWTDKTKVTEEFLLQCDQTDEVKELLKDANPKYEKWV